MVMTAAAPLTLVVAARPTPVVARPMPAGEADAGGEADAAPTVEGDEYLLGVALPGTPLGDGLLRLIATVDVADDGTSADFSLQPISLTELSRQR